MAYSADDVQISVDGQTLSGLTAFEPPDFVNDLVAVAEGTKNVSHTVISTMRQAEMSYTMLMISPQFSPQLNLAQDQSKGKRNDVAVRVSIPALSISWTAIGNYKKPPKPVTPGFGETTEDAAHGEFSMVLTQLQITSDQPSV